MLKNNATNAMYRLQIDLTGFSSNTFLEGWSMTARSLKALNATLVAKDFIGVFSVKGDISREDDNSPGDNKVYIGVETLVAASSESQAINRALAIVTGAVENALPPRGGFSIDGAADCLESSPAVKNDMDKLSSVLPREMRAAMYSMAP